MKLSIKVQTPPAMFGELAKKTRGAVAGAINRTLEEAQAKARQALGTHLTIRTPTSRRFLENLIKFERFDRATEAKLFAQMGIQSSGTGTRGGSASLLALLTEGGVRFNRGGEPIAIPTSGPAGVRQSPTQVISKLLYPRNLGLLERRGVTGTEFAGLHKRGSVRRTSTGTKVVLRGSRRTFAIDPRFQPGADPRTLGVYQRRGVHGPALGRSGASQTFYLWVYRMQVRVPKRYPFLEIAGTVAAERFPINLAGFLTSITGAR